MARSRSSAASKDAHLNIRRSSISAQHSAVARRRWRGLQHGRFLGRKRRRSTAIYRVVAKFGHCRLFYHRPWANIRRLLVPSASRLLSRSSNLLAARLSAGVKRLFSAITIVSIDLLSHQYRLDMIKYKTLFYLYMAICSHEIDKNARQFILCYQ